MSPIAGRAGRPPDPAKADAAIAAAQALFLARGYERTSMEAIARAAGIAKPTLYAHFGGKEALFAAAVSRKCAAVLGELDVAEKDRPAEEVLVEAGCRFLRLVLDPEALRTHRLVAVERDRHPELGRLFFDNAILFTRARMTALITRLRAGGLAIGDPEQAAVDLLTLLRGWPVLTWELAGTIPDPAEQTAHARRCVALILKAHG